ncbi:MAG TPA: hypothetical protein VMN57_16510 [Anaerolineales bacterium]|nr:hypothetical protein [Anaerolineales bacterium]
MHFNDFEAPVAPDDQQIEDLTGCPIHKRIDAVCPEPGCPSGERSTQADRPIWQRDPTAPTRPAGIYQTQPKDRCVM